MRVAKITDQGDWTFGKGLANYAVDAAAVRQNVVTRLRSFTRDWFLDMRHGNDWLRIFGTRNNERKFLKAAEACVLGTAGVKNIRRLRIVSVDGRSATVELSFTSLFDEADFFNEQVTVP